MNQPSGKEPFRQTAIRIGALAPLSRPGWVEAGRHLLAGLELAVGEVNDAGGIEGRPLELVVRDTAADPQRAVAAVDELDGLGVVALAGEYHSVVARAAAARADALGLPFLCSSAVLDALAIMEKAHEFTLVSWRPIIGRQVKVSFRAGRSRGS